MGVCVSAEREQERAEREQEREGGRERRGREGGREGGKKVSTSECRGTSIQISESKYIRNETKWRVLMSRRRNSEIYTIMTRDNC